MQSKSITAGTKVRIDLSLSDRAGWQGVCTRRGAAVDEPNLLPIFWRLSAGVQVRFQNPGSGSGRSAVRVEPESEAHSRDAFEGSGEAERGRSPLCNSAACHIRVTKAARGFSPCQGRHQPVDTGRVEGLFGQGIGINGQVFRPLAFCGHAHGPDTRQVEPHTQETPRLHAAHTPGAANGESFLGRGARQDVAKPSTRPS